MMREVVMAILLLGLRAFGMGADDGLKAMEQVRSSAEYRKAIVATYTRYESGLSTHCPTVHVDMQQSKARVLVPVELTANAAISKGQWVESTRGEACGQSRTYNALVMYTAGKPMVYPLFPGHSFALALLQRDAVMYAGIAAGAARGCAIEVLDTSLPEGEPSGPKAPWVERWTVRACDKESMVTLHFIPDATGTTISASARDTVAVPR